jgi:hypothetical protein
LFPGLVAGRVQHVLVEGKIRDGHDQGDKDNKIEPPARRPGLPFFNDTATTEIYTLGCDFKCPGESEGRYEAKPQDDNDGPYRRIADAERREQRLDNLDQ